MKPQIAHAEPRPQLDAGVRHFVVRLSPTPHSARLARHLALRQLEEWGIAGHGRDTSDRVGLIVAEFAANAVTHGRVPGRDFQLRLECGTDTIRVEVSDTRSGGEVPADPAVPSGEANSGRGLCLINAVASRWGVEGRVGPGKTVWAEVDLRPSGGEEGEPCRG